MANDYHNIALSLAGVCQAAHLVQQLAHSGQADKNAFEISMNSLLKTSPTSVLDVYGNDTANLKLGLKSLLEQLNGENVELARYWLGLLALSGKLAKNADAKAELARRIQYLPTQLEFHQLFDDEMLNIIATIYTDIISPLGKRLLVQGKPLYLSQEKIQNRIRACLLAGIRSAMLWQQVGGSKWQILFSRRKIFNAAQAIYNSL